VEVRVPASTSNLGSGFDCCGLALELYLKVRAEVVPEPNERCQIRTSGEDSERINSLSVCENLIYRTMRFVAEHEHLNLPALRLGVQNKIPLGSGLGSSGAAIIAGIALAASLCGAELSREKILRYASAVEGHADNVAAALLGGLVINCLKPEGDVLAIKRFWPAHLKVITVTPQYFVETKRAREILPEIIDRRDAVYNLQRVALFGAALETEDYDLLWEAMQDRMHQTERARLVPGLAEALATPRHPGLLGLALSGSGPTVVALASDRLTEIGDLIAGSFRKHKLSVQVRVLGVDHLGLHTFISSEAETIKTSHLPIDNCQELTV
jgi:homoserine kinase